MRFNIITIFPKIFNSYFSESILARAQKRGLIEIKVHDLRQWTSNKHKTVDDSPYGGGPGMVMKVEPIYKAIKELSFPRKPSLAWQKRGSESWISGQTRNNKKEKTRIILFSAKGKPYTQTDARRLAKYDQLILICGRYEGVDERVAAYIADEELSVGNFVLTGGEIPAMIVVDTASRLIPGVLGKKESLAEESFSEDGYTEYAQYTRPEKFRGWKVPKILLSGNHEEIRKWREKQSFEKTEFKVFNS